jgi:hypothetical protein
MKVALILVCFSSALANSQGDDTTSRKFSMSYELNAGPSYGNKGYTSVPLFSGSGGINQRRQEVIGEPNFNISAGLGFKIFDFLGIKTRLSYNRLAYHSVYKNAILVGSDAHSGPVYTSGFYKFNFQMFTLGLDAKLLKNAERSLFFFGLGVDYGLVWSRYLINNNKPTIYPIQGHNDQFFGAFGMSIFGGTEIPIGKRSIHAEIRYTVFNPTKGNLYWQYLYSVGIGLGYRFGEINITKTKTAKLMKNRSYSVFLEPRSNYVLRKSPGHVLQRFTCHYGAAIGATVNYSNGLKLSSALSYNILNTLNFNALYNQNYYQKFGFAAVSFTVYYDLLKVNQKHFFAPHVQLGYGLITNNKFRRWPGDSGLYPPHDAASYSTSAFKKYSHYILFETGLSYLTKLKHNSSLGMRIVYGRNVANLSNTNSKFHFLSMGVIYEYSF